MLPSLVGFRSTGFTSSLWRLFTLPLRVKCLTQERNTMSLARARTWTARSRAECTNHEATMPPTTYYLISLMIRTVNSWLAVRLCSTVSIDFNIVMSSSLANTLPKTTLIISCDEAAVKQTLPCNVSLLPVQLFVMERTSTFDVSWINAPLKWLPLPNELSDLLSLTDKVDKGSPLSGIESASIHQLRYNKSKLVTLWYFQHPYMNS